MGPLPRETRPRRWNRATAGDVVLVLTLVGIAVVHEVVDPDDRGSVGAFVFGVALVLPLLARRRWPLGVFLTVAAVAALQWTFGPPVPTDLAVLVALYTLGSRDPRRWAVASGALIAQFGVLLAVVRWAPPGHWLDGLILLTGTVTAAWVLGVYMRTRRAYITTVLERAATAERERDQQAQLATASERARISREMHDIVAHSLSVMIALSDGAAAAVEGSPREARRAMQQASTLGRQSLGEVRRLLGTIHEEGPDLAPAPGIAQLDDLAAQVRAAGPAVELVVVGAPLPLPPAAQLTVYRMVQEALTNVLKHAPGATRAVVTLTYGPSSVTIEVENDGDASPARSGTNPGHGLEGMRERAAVFAGHVAAGPKPGGGWLVGSTLRLQDQVVSP